MLLSNFTAVTEHPHSGPRKQSLSGRQLPPSGESHPAQRKRMQHDANKVPQQIMHPQYSMYYSLISIKVWFQTWFKFQGIPKNLLIGYSLNASLKASPIKIGMLCISLQKQVGCFNHRVVTLVTDKLVMNYLHKATQGAAAKSTIH